MYLLKAFTPDRSIDARLTSLIPWTAGGILVVAILPPLLGSNMLLSHGYHDTQRMLQLALFGMLVIVSLARLRLAAPTLLIQGRPNRQFWGLTFVLATSLASSLLAASPPHAFFELGVFFFCALGAWLVATEVAGTGIDRIRLVLMATVVGSLLYAFVALVAYAAALASGEQPVPGNLIPGYDNYRFFNHGQTITLPLLALFLCGRDGQKGADTQWRVAGWSALALWWMLLLVSTGRGTLIGITAGAIFALLLRRRRAWPWVRTLATGALIGTLLYLILYIAVPLLAGLEPFGYLGRVVQRSVANPTSGRGMLWSCALDAIRAHPWLGIGPLHYAEACAATGIAAHPHNWVLQIAAEWGIPALACMLIILGGCLHALIRIGSSLSTSDRENQNILACWLGTGAAIFVDGLVSGLIVMPVSQLWITLYAGLMWGWILSMGDYATVRHDSNPWLQYMIAGSVLSFGILLAIGIHATASSAFSHQGNTDKVQNLNLRARAWENGFFALLRQ